MNSLNKKTKRLFFDFLEDNNFEKIEELIDTDQIYKEDSFFLNEIPFNFFEDLGKMNFDLKLEKNKNLWEIFSEESIKEENYDYYISSDADHKNNALTIDMKSLFVLLNKEDLLKKIISQTSDPQKSLLINKRIKFYSNIFLLNDSKNCFPFFHIMDKKDCADLAQYLDFDKDRAVQLLNDYGFNYILYKNSEKINSEKYINYLKFLSYINVFNENNNEVSYKHISSPDETLKKAMFYILDKNEKESFFEIFPKNQQVKNSKILSCFLPHLEEIGKNYPLSSLNYFKKLSEWVEEAENTESPLEYLLFKKYNKPRKSSFLSKILENKRSFDLLNSYLANNPVSFTKSEDKLNFYLNIGAKLCSESFRKEILDITNKKNKKDLESAALVVSCLHSKEPDFFNKINENNKIIESFIYNSAFPEKLPKLYSVIEKINIEYETKLDKKKKPKQIFL